MQNIRLSDGAEKCVVCGKEIPEGRQVCVICGYKVKAKINKTRLLTHLKDLHDRLVLNYNDNTPFKQLEEDRLVVSNVIELLEK